MIENKVIEAFKTNIRFKEIVISLLSRHYQWDNTQLIKYKDILDFGDMMLMKNEHVKWNLELVDILKNDIDWSSFWKTNNIELNLKFFDRYKDVLDFSSIHFHKHIDWSNQLLDTYQDKWNWEGLTMKSIVARERNINKYAERLDWEKFSRNKHITFSEDLIDAHIDKWNWKELCANPAFRIGVLEIEKYKDKLDWYRLSNNPSMVPFILAFPNSYPWNWTALTQNQNVYFSDKLIKFLITKIKNSFTVLKNTTEEVQTNFAKSSLIKSASLGLNFDRDIWFTEYFKNQIPWKELIKRKPNVLTSQEIEEHLCIDDFEKVLPYEITQSLSTEYIYDNTEKLMKFRWSLFRYGKIDEDFIALNSINKDWFQLAFNEQFNWTIDFLIVNIERFESNYGLSQNKRLFEVLFNIASEEDVNNLLQTY